MISYFQYYCRYTKENAGDIKVLFDKPTRDSPEKWRVIIGTNKRYSVSSHGKIRLNEYTERNSLGYIRHMGSRMLNPCPRSDRDGLWIKYTLRGKRVQKNIGILVAETFLYRPVRASHVVWLNGDTHDNNVVNLAWKTNKYAQPFNSNDTKQRRLSLSK